jgi:hypothetical protein
MEILLLGGLRLCAVHPKTNRSYYFYQELNISQWERPDVATGSRANIIQEEGLNRKNGNRCSDSEQLNEKTPSNNQLSTWNQGLQGNLRQR